MTMMRSAFRSVSRRLFSTLSVSFVLGLCVAVLISTIAGVGASEGSIQRMVDEVETSTAEMVAQVEATAEEMVASVEEGTEETTDLAEKMARMILVFNLAYMNEDDVNDIYSIEGVAAVAPRLLETVGGSLLNRDYDYLVHGVLLDPSLVEEYPVLPANIVAGRQIDDGDGAAVLLNLDRTDYFNAGVGDIITLEGSEFEVVGIFYGTGFLDQKAIFMSLENAQNLFDKGGKVLGVQVFADAESDVDSVADEIGNLHIGIVRTMADVTRFREQIVQTVEEQLSSIRNQATLQIETIQYRAELQIATLQNDLGNIERLGVQISLVAGIAGVLMIFGIMFYRVRERTREIGVLKALGFSNPYVMMRFMLEGSYIGLFGGLIGVALGAAACSLLGPWLLDISESTSVTLEPYHLLIGLGAAVLSGAFGSLYPAWRASRVSPMEALRRG